MGQAGARARANPGRVESPGWGAGGHAARARGLGVSAAGSHATRASEQGNERARRVRSARSRACAPRGGTPRPAEWLMRLFSSATASRVAAPRSPPLLPHESGFLPRRVAESSSSISPSLPHLGSPPSTRTALTSSGDARAADPPGLTPPAHPKPMVPFVQSGGGYRRDPRPSTDWRGEAAS